VLQVFLTGMVPLAVGPGRPQHVDFNYYYVRSEYLRRFTDKAAWRDAIFAHLEHNPELLMLRLWQCVEANREGRSAPSLDDLVEQPPTPVWQSLAILAAWGSLILTCLFLIFRCFRIRLS